MVGSVADYETGSVTGSVIGTVVTVSVIGAVVAIASGCVPTVGADIWLDRGETVQPVRTAKIMEKQKMILQNLFITRFLRWWPHHWDILM